MKWPEWGLAAWTEPESAWPGKNRLHLNFVTVLDKTGLSFETNEIRETFFEPPASLKAQGTPRKIILSAGWTADRKSACKLA
jgi:hypothetical protein